MWNSKHARTQDTRRIKTLKDPKKMETLCVDCSICTILEEKEAGRRKKNEEEEEEKSDWADGISDIILR